MMSVWRQFVSSDFQRPFFFLVGMGALLCLTSVWAVDSSRHWFWRALAVWGAFGLLVPIGAWDPAWMFGLVVPALVVVVGGVRWLRGRRGVAGERATRWRFTLRDLLLLILIVSLWMPVVLKVVRAFQPYNWYGWLASSGAIAVVALLAVARAYMQRQPMEYRDWVLLAAEFGVGLWLIGAYQKSAEAFGLRYLFTLVVAAVLVWRGWCHWKQMLMTLLLLGAIPLVAEGVLKAGFWVVCWGPIGSSAYKPAEKIGMIALFAIELAWALISILLLVANAQLTNAVQPLRSYQGRVIAIVLSMWAIGVGAIYVNLLMIRAAPTVAKFTSPVNHYERIMEIAERAVVLSPRYESIASVRRTTPKAADELDTLCQELMLLLEAPNFVPFDPDARHNYSWLGNHHHAVQMFPRILAAESAERSEANELDSAAEYALAIVRLGDLQCRGSLDGDFSIGTNLRRRGLQLLVTLHAKLSPRASRKLITTLQQSIEGRDDAEVSWARKLWYRQDGWDGWALNLERVLFENQERQRFASQTQRYERRQELGKRLLQAEMAVRLCLAERGEVPEKLSQLVPDYLVAVPVDLNGQPLELRREMDGGWVVHCVGWGGVHAGGSFFDPPRFPQAEGFGVDLDYLSRQQF